MFVALSMNYQYFAERINLFIAEAPVAKTFNTKSKLLKELSKFSNLIEDILVDDFGLYNFVMPNWWESEAMALFCSHYIDICDSFFELTADEDTSVDNMGRIKTLMTHFPAGSGYRCVVHYSQLMQTDKFQRFDFGIDENQLRYGQNEPPFYDLDMLRGEVPIAFFAGSLDELADETDVQWLYEQLGEENVVYYQTFELGHLTFGEALDMSWFQNDGLDLLSKYATNEAVSGAAFNEFL